MPPIRVGTYVGVRCSLSAAKLSILLIIVTPQSPQQVHKTPASYFRLRFDHHDIEYV